MGYFDEQIRKKIKLEDERFEESLDRLSEVVTGKRVWRMSGEGGSLNKKSLEDLAGWLNVSIPKNYDGTLSFDAYLETFFRPRGIMWRNVQLKGDWYRDHSGIMVGTLKSGERVVFVPSGKNAYFYHDPESGKKIRVNKEKAALFEEDAVLFYRNLPLRKLTMQDIRRFALRSVSLREILTFVIATVVLTILSMVFPSMTKRIITDYNALSFIFLELVLITVIMFLVTIIKQLVLPRITTKVAVSLQAAFMMRVLTSPMDQIKHFAAGDLGSRIGGMYQNIRVLLTMLLSIALTAACAMISFIQMFVFSPALGGVALMLTAVLVLIYIRVIIRQVKTSEARMAYSAEESGLTYSLIDGMQKITLSGAEKRAFSVWADVYGKSMKTIYDPPLLLKIFSVLTPSVLLAGNILMYFVAAAANVDQADFFAFSSSFAIVTGALASISVNVTDFANALPIFRNLKAVMDITPELDGEKKQVKDLGGHIKLQDICFRYEKDMPLVINELSLDIPPGSYVAIVGSTGCGKSTLVKLLLGFEKPESGEIYYDRFPLSTLDLTTLRRNIGTVLQNGDIFQGTIFHNITISGAGLSEEDAWEAAQIAGIADDIRSMPLQMNTPVSTGGGISGGQKQRILIARAIASKPKILIFDEATSALDNITQKAVSEAVGELNCTRIVIAHRLSTIQNCDRIICLDKGRIIEQGSYDELMELGGFFCELVKKQQI